jgi:hypothetical protein
MENPAEGFAAVMQVMVKSMGDISKAFYNKFGKEALPVITEAASRSGVEQGKLMRHDMPAQDMKATGESLGMMGSMLGIDTEMLELSDTVYHFKLSKCPLGIEGTSKELCEALMANDKMMVSTLLGKDVDMKIFKSIAAGDEKCEIMYTIK